MTLPFVATRRRIVRALAVGACLWLCVSPACADDAPPERAAGNKPAPDAAIKKLIEKAAAVRDRAVKARRTAQGAGSYKVTATDNTGAVVYRERAAFRMVRDGARQFFLFWYEPGAGYEDRDVYARVALTDGAVLYESRFCRRIAGGVEGKITASFEKGTLQPAVWISGNLANYYSFIQLLLKKQNLKLSLRDENGLKVVKGLYPGGKAAEEFWIDPQRGWHIVRYRSMNYTRNPPFATTDVTRDWKQTSGVWRVKRCTHIGVFRDKAGNIDRREVTELAFDTFDCKVKPPEEVFTVHALGLPEGARIFQDNPLPIQRYHRDPDFDMAKVEKAVGKLPTPLPRR